MKTFCILLECMNTVLIKLKYYGKPFCGFARQPERMTVQGSLEEALATVFGKKIETTCAGRTDSGVHALAQYVSFSHEEVNCEKLKASLEALTHDDIHILDIVNYQGEFSARFDAKGRHYSYYICNNQTPSLFMKDFSWHIAKPLNVTAMKEASRYLIGEHDFKSFCTAASAVGKPTCRYVKSIEFGKYEDCIEIKICANAFLHSMVRTIVGTLVKVGQGHREPEWVNEVLTVRDRQAAGENAPAKGLVLMAVDYDKI